MMPGFAVLLPFVQTAPDPLAPARAGQIQCTGIDKAHRKCLAMTRYEPVEGGGFRNITTITVSGTPLITIEMASLVVVEGDAVCGTLRQDDVAAAKVRVNGTPMPAGDATPLVERIVDGTREAFGQKVCTRFRIDGDQILSETQIDGTPRPDMNLRFTWVRPEDGYSVGWEP